MEKLRYHSDCIVELAARQDGKVVGHVALGKMSAPLRALGLAPVAVAESHRRRGIAATLIRAAAGGWQAVFVLGDPAHYGRFGFAAASAEPFESPTRGRT